MRQQKLQERFQFESTQMKGYELIYPCPDKVMNDKYDEMINKSQELWDEFYVGKNRRKEQHNLAQ